MGSTNDADEIKNHQFFEEVDWKLLQEKKIDPPYIPKLNGPKDLKFFDKVMFFYLNFILFHNILEFI